MKVIVCSATKANGEQCRGWASKSGLCPVHSGKVHGFGGERTEVVK